MFKNPTAPLLAGALAILAMHAANGLEARLELVAEKLTAPVLLVSPPGDERRFIVEQVGVIKILQPDGRLLDEPFLNLRHRLVDRLSPFDERGLLGLAFHPDFVNNGKFYVAYSGRIRGDADLGRQVWYTHTNYVSEWRVSANDPNRADPDYERVVSKIDWPQFNHNGHWIGFGPDGYLYISTGDGGYANDWGIGHHVTKGNGQDLAVRHGKILRVDVNGQAPYAIPDDNPFVGRNDVAPEIWAYGFRNPWRCAFDLRGDQRLFCGDIGQDAFEEVDIVQKGGNYGWRVKEASRCFDYVNPTLHPPACDDAGMIEPILEYRNCTLTEDCEGGAVTGGHVYRGAHEAWDGLYFFGDWSKRFATGDGRLFVARERNGNWTMEPVKITNMRQFDAYVLALGQDHKGEIYVLTTNSVDTLGARDRIYQIVP